MDELFEKLIKTHGIVTIELDSIATITGEIVSTDRFEDGLKLYFDNNTEYFISSVYNYMWDKNMLNNYTQFCILDEIHHLVIHIKIYEFYT